MSSLAHCMHQPPCLIIVYEASHVCPLRHIHLSSVSSLKYSLLRHLPPYSRAKRCMCCIVYRTGIFSENHLTGRAAPVRCKSKNYFSNLHSEMSLRSHLL